MNSPIYGQFITKDPRLYNKIISSTSSVRTCKRMIQGHYLISHKNTNSKWIKYLNVRSEITRVGKDIRENFLGIDLSSDFFGFDNKSKISKWDHIKLKSFCIEKKAVNEMKSQLTE